MMLEVAPEKVQSKHKVLGDEYKHRHWFGDWDIIEVVEAGDGARPPHSRFVEDMKGKREGWRTEPLDELHSLKEFELSVKGESEFFGGRSLRSTAEWRDRWGSLESACYAALRPLERDRYIWRKWYKPANRVNKVMKIGLLSKGIQAGRAFAEEDFQEFLDSEFNKIPLLPESVRPAVLKGYRRIFRVKNLVPDS